jgi:2-hydroxychromene-2-carboxylate isomerase
MPRWNNAAGVVVARDVDFFWDIGSTNSYFALHLVRPIVARHGARLISHPFNLGYVFRAQAYVLMDEPPAKLSHRFVDLRRWAERYRLPFRMPDAFPIKTSRVLRGALAMRRIGKEWPYIDAVFQAYWEQNDASIADYAGLHPIVRRMGVDPAEFEALSESEPVRKKLIAETQGGMARGVFGAPTFFVGDEMFWGKDRMEFLEAALATPSP